MLTKVKIPGKTNPVYMHEPISVDAPNFTWGEALHGGNRLPKDWKITANIIKLAEFIQKLRGEVFGDKAIRVSSWLRVPYRDGSFHYKGLAIDINVAGLTPRQVYDKLNSLPELTNQGLGKYDGHTHVDLRGYRARWSGKSR